MKSTLALSLPLVVSAATLKGDFLEKRQLGGILGKLTGNLKPLAPVKTTKDAQPLLFPAAKREKVLWGPFKLGAAGGKRTNAGGIKLDDTSDTIMSMLQGACKDCMVLNANMEISDKDGVRLGVNEGIYVHHFVTVNMGTQQLANPVQVKCGDKLVNMAPNFAGMSIPKSGGQATNMGTPRPASGGAMSGGHSHGRRQAGIPGFPALSTAVFVGKGNEEGGANTFSAVNSTVKSGFYLGKSDQLIMTAEVINYQPVDREVFVFLDYEYLPSPAGGQKPKDYMDVGMGTIGVTGCPGSEIGLVPPRDRAITYTSPEWYFSKNGYLVNIHAHMHDGGTYIAVKVNDKEVCRQEAIYAPDKSGDKWEAISGYSGCHDAIKFKKGDKAVMVAEYDLTKRKLRPHAGDSHGGEAEGMALATFNWALAPDQSDKW